MAVDADADVRHPFDGATVCTMSGQKRIRADQTGAGAAVCRAAVVVRLAARNRLSIGHALPES
jgi:hypothetical protein